MQIRFFQCSGSILRLENCSSISNLNKRIKYLLKNKENPLFFNRTEIFVSFFPLHLSYFFSPWFLLAYLGLVSEWIEENIEESVIYFIFSTVALPNHSQKKHSLLHFQKQIITSSVLIIIFKCLLCYTILQGTHSVLWESHELSHFTDEKIEDWKWCIIFLWLKSIIITMNLLVVGFYISGFTEVIIPNKYNHLFLTI